MKKVLKSTKGKIVAGATAVALLTGGGYAFASTDAGEALQNWYNKQFNQSASSMQGELTKYAEGKASYIIGQGREMMDGATDDINGTKANEIEGAEGEIENALDGYLNDIEGTQTTISAGIEGQFNWVYGLAITELDKLAAEGKTYANDVLKEHASRKGGKAVAEVNTKLTKAKDNAVQELEDVIQKAKDGLEAELLEERTKTVGELKAAIDNKIEEVKDELQVLLDGYVVTQQQLIADKAAEIESAAKDELANAVTDGFK